MAEQNNNSPSLSPKKPNAVSAGLDWQQELSARVVNEVFELQNVDLVAEGIFSLLSDLDDQQIFGGQIPKDPNNPNLDPYIEALNGLFPLARNSQGGLNQMNPSNLIGLNPKLGLLMTQKGNQFVNLVCDIVNEESAARIPKTSISNANVQKAFSLSEISHFDQGDNSNNMIS